jgi:hypothetical protein
MLLAVGALVLVFGALFGVQYASAEHDPAQHGISVTKGCDSPTLIGAPYLCTYTARNTIDDPQDTLTFTSIVDTVQSSAGPVVSANLVPQLSFVIGPFLPGFSTPPSCNGTGSGTLADPFVGQTMCTLPYGSRLNSLPFAFYTVTADDFNLPDHELTDDFDLIWQDLCNGLAYQDHNPTPPPDFLPPEPGGGNCDATPPTVGAGSATIVEQLPSTTVTTIHNNANHAPVLVVPVGTSVHDFVEVSGGPGNPIPAGNVIVDWFTNFTCTGSPVSSSAPTPLVGGSVDVTSFVQGPLAAGLYSFQARYLGDPDEPVYEPSTGACEPLRVVDARITITPDGVNRVGQTHMFTAHVFINDGTGETNAPAGTAVSFSVDGGAPSLFCNTVGVTGQCTVNLTSAVTGVDVVTASTTVSVFGVSLTRSTTGAPNSGPATKRWVNARISINPDATNTVGEDHTFTVLLEEDAGDGLGFVPSAGETVTVTLTNSNGAVAAPAGPFVGVTNALGQFQVTFTSATPGTVTGHASSMLSVAGSAPFTVETDGLAGNSDDAVKQFVNAHIGITPATDTNAVGTNHVLTITVTAIGGPLAAGTATANIVSGPGDFVPVGANTCNYAAAAAGVGSTCTVTISSATVGTTVVSATSSIGVAGETIVRTTGTPANLAAGGTGNASKTWVNANIQITPATATNPIGTNHVLLITVNAIGGTLANGTATANIVSGPGDFVPAGANTCNYIGGGVTASCSVTISSATVGTTVVSATSAITVNGETMTRTTNTAVNTAAGGSDNASKTWVAARIRITPDDVNEIGQSHTFTVTVETNGGSGFAPAPGAPVTVTLTNSNGAVATPAGPFNGTTDASGQFQVTFTSNTPGQVTGTATSTVTVGGQPIALSTNGVAPNSGPAVKTFVDANIQISPLLDTNPVGSPHVLTVHVNVNPGSGFVNAPAGTPVTVTTNFGTITGSPCLTVGATGTCTVTLNSASAGTSTVNATVTTTVNGVTLTRTTNGVGLNSGPAIKNWADTAVRTDIHNTSHAVITTASPGDVVHDKVFVTKASGTPASVPAPTGNVIFHRFETLNCTGTSVDQTVALAADGTAETSTFTVVDDMSYRAEYLGDANYPARLGPCEPLSVQAQGCPFCPPMSCPAFPVFPGQGGGGGPCSFSVLATSIKGNVVEITVQNTGSADAPITGVSLAWPTANGALKQVAVDGYLYNGPGLTGGTALLTVPNIGPAQIRTIKVGQSEKLRLIFEKPAAANAALYDGKLQFGAGCELEIL